MKLRTKIFLAISSIVIFSVTIIAGTVFAYTEDYIKDTATSNAKMTLSIQHDRLQTILSSIQSSVSSAYVSDSFLHTFLNVLMVQKEGNMGLVIGQLSNILNMMKNSDRYINSIYVSTAWGGFFDISLPKRADFDFSQTEIYKKFEEDPNIYCAMGKEGINEIYAGKDIVIPMGFRLTAPDRRTKVIIVVNINSKMLQESISQDYYKQKHAVALFDSNNRLIMGTEDPKLDAMAYKMVNGEYNTDTSEDLVNENEYLIGQKTLQSPLKIKIVMFHSQRQLMQRQRSLYHLAILLVSGSLLAGFAWAYCISKSITKPIYNLIETVKHIKQNEFDVELSYTQNNEVGQLSTTIQAMAQEIKQLIEDLRDEKVNVEHEAYQKRKAELKVLHAQINPHFLYNTLDSINWKAVELGSQDISQMTTSLAKFFRTGIIRGREIVPLTEEISHVESYLVIQKMRYESQFDYCFEIGDECCNCYCIKLIVQPLVENAIYHGIKESDVHGEITIKCFTDESKLYIEVINNGVPISQAQAASINQRLAQRKQQEDGGYGIFNVNERIKLHFGTQYGLTLKRGSNDLTIASVTLPKLSSREASNYV